MSTTSNGSLVGLLLDGRYRIADRIASGGMASVYLATDIRLDRTVAVKVMHSGLGDDGEFTQRFEREARAAARLNHPNVVAVFDQGEDDGLVYLVMEYVAGRTLRDVIRDEAPMSPARALALLDPLLVALSAAHEARIIHRDVKPENVLITPDGRVKVADFGLARAVSSVTTSSATTGVLIGTVSYLAPELVVNQGADARSDVYAVGAVLYELLTGSKPHSGDSPIQIAYEHVHVDVPAPSALAPGIPSYVDALVARATSRDRDQRSADATILLRQVRRARIAVENEVVDDADLTDDLRPHPRTPDPFASADQTVVVPTEQPRESRSGADRTTPGLEAPEATTPMRLPDSGGSESPPAPGRGASRRPRRRRTGPVLLVAVLLLALLAAAGGWYYGVGRFDDTPDLRGLRLAKAQHHADDAGFTLQVTRKAYSETVPRGAVVATDPGPGDQILPDGTIDAIVSKGKERYAVPKLRGVDENTARARLADRHLVLGDVRRKYSEKIDKGAIIRTTRKTGALVRRDAEVGVVLSKGRRPIEVSDVAGLRSRKARHTLTESGLDPSVEHQYDDEVPAGHVISQDPENGTLHKGDPVELVVSDGPEPVEVPRVVGKSASDAREILEDAGFEVKVEKERFYVGGGLVLRQSPSSGKELRPGSTVTIHIV